MLYITVKDNTIHIHALTLKAIISRILPVLTSAPPLPVLTTYTHLIPYPTLTSPPPLSPALTPPPPVQNTEVST